MSTYAIGNELSGIGLNTRRSTGISLAVHILLFLWIVLHHTVAAPSEGLTEITWVEPAPKPAPAPLQAAPPVARKETKSAPTQEVTEKPSKQEVPQQIERQLVRAKVAPDPQSPLANEDVMNQRLQSLQRNAKNTETRISALVPPPRVGTPSLAGVPTAATPSATPSTLQRTEGTASPSPPVALSRVGTDRPHASAVTVPVAATARPTAEAATPSASDARRNVAGAQLVGPVADRKLVTLVKPIYPDWAKRDGVEGSVTLRFYVLPDGRVKENIMIEKTSGFSDFDDNAIAALKQWRFEALSGGREQWGSITFHYRLTDAAN